jgi:TatD DNase family protein
LLLDILEMEPLAGRSVLHWFTGSQQDIARASDMGCWFSVGSPMLYSAAGKRAVSHMPIERILPETDGPFGMIDGEPLYPWQAMDVVGELSKLLAIPSSDLAKMLTDNFQRLTSASIRMWAAVRA